MIDRILRRLGPRRSGLAPRSEPSRAPVSRRPRRWQDAADLTAPMPRTREALRETVNLCHLGSWNDRPRWPRDLLDRARVFCLDAVEPGSSAAPSGRDVPGAPEVVAIRRAIGPTAGTGSFVERAFPGCSSIREPDPLRLAEYGLESLYAPIARRRVETVTLAEIARDHGVGRWHAIKTDLEGIDLPVVRSLGDAIRETLVVQMELRFQPLYEGEPEFCEAVSYLARHGFEVLDVRPERWRYATPHRLHALRGRSTLCNAVFVNGRVAGREGGPADVLVQALILGVLGYTNFAERLASALDAPIRAEMDRFLFGPPETRVPFEPYAGFPYATHSAEE
jgi:hypothetical protein